jgi:UDP-N-acetylmuramoyl-tripeptide--D-alanyl-D-alanine ligase
VIPLRLAEVAELVEGRLDSTDGQAVVTGAVELDSRRIAAGGLFVALPGERVDGADYATAAVEAGATGVLASRPVGVPAVVVADPAVGLAALAAGVLARLRGARPDDAGAVPTTPLTPTTPTVVGVTGSSGKTSTKDLLAQLLPPLGPVVAPEGSYNNELGLPLTVLRADAATRTLVLEMGARRPGNIAQLCRVAPPDVAVVLNVGTAHLGVFGDRAAIARTKGELVEALPGHGTAVLNADDPLVRGMAERTGAAVVMVGTSVHADVRAEDVRLDAAGRPRFTLVRPDGSAEVALRLHGEHHVGNALAAAAVGMVLGLDVRTSAERLSAATPRSRWRMEVVERADGVTVVNDAYNANPDSVRAALRALVAMGGQQRRTWAVLGEMLELGDEHVSEHDAVGRLAVRLDVDRLVAVGEGARAIHLGAVQEGSWGEESAAVADVEAALALLRRELRPGDVVLVKASRAAGLDVLAQRLVDDLPAAAPA